MFGEVGVLTDRDIELYRKTLPNLSQPEDIRKSVTAITLRSLKNALENQIKSAASFGRDVSGVESQYLELSEEVNRIESELGLPSEEKQFEYTFPEDQPQNVHVNNL